MHLSVCVQVHANTVKMCVCESAYMGYVHMHVPACRHVCELYDCMYLCTHTCVLWLPSSGRVRMPDAIQEAIKVL